MKKFIVSLSICAMLFGVPSAYAQYGVGDTVSTAVPVSPGSGYGTFLQGGEADIFVYNNSTALSVTTTANLQSPAGVNYNYWVEIHNPGGSVTTLNPWDNGIGSLDSIQITVGPGSKAYFIVSDTGTLSSASYSFWLN
ncbi:hypothetical protein [Paenibacillus nasutitermitis]|uniref:Uncharacterized protein n=1 Tax=Paenibacillus nasutitermitis TaxID=1652958 RepID=A0A916Z8S5_9BACL|nr:hypothetical protein [Paenibacillus nasutitermitis]GGD81864.1 hypothetical protein GCM10010911_44970 [Paenibacillus nasutitermitis]